MTDDYDLLTDMPPMIGPYRPVAPIGQGGMAKVYRAVHPRRQETSFAIKQMLPDHAAHSQFRAAFARELETTSAFRHSNIVLMHEHGVAGDGTPYMVMELVEGLDLRAFQRAHPGHQLPAAWVILIALDLANALEYVHDTRRAGSSAVLHRDISPQNVLLAPNGHSKLTDFGIAKAVDEQGAAAVTGGSVPGKLMYMSPEQAMGEDLDARADLYSLGLVLFELIAGEPAFKGSGQTKLFALVHAADRPALASLAPAETPPILIDIVEGLLRPDRDARTPDASTLIRQLTPLAPAFFDRIDLSRAVAEYKNRANRRAVATSAPRPLPTEAPSSTLEVQPGDIKTAIARSKSPEPLPEVVTDAPTRPRAVEPVPSPATTIIPKRRRGLPKRMGLIAAAAATVVLAGGAGAYLATQESPAQLPGHLAGPALNVADTASTASAGATPSATTPPAAPPPAAAPQAASAQPPPAEPPAAPPMAPQTAAAPEVATPEAAVPTPVAVTPPDTQPASATDRQRPAATATPGTVRVVVIPWGNVWADGAAQGEAPQTLSLRPGRHTIAVGQGAQSERRAITVRAGETQTVRFDLRE